MSRTLTFSQDTLTNAIVMWNDLLHLQEGIPNLSGLKTTSCLCEHRLLIIIIRTTKPTNLQVQGTRITFCLINRRNLSYLFCAVPYGLKGVI